MLLVCFCTFASNFFDMPSTLILKIHLISVTLFLVFYLMKTFFLLTGKATALERWTKSTRIAEMAVSALFLVSGIWLVAIIGGIKTMQIVKLLLVFSSIPLAVIGFKRRSKIMALASFVLLISAYGISEASRAKPFAIKHAPPSLAADKPALGKFLYENNCVYCHGIDGTKMYRDATDLSLSTGNATVTEAVIRNGRNKAMPAYGSVLSEEEINALSEYLMTLRK
jgi:cytochrome c5